LVKLLVVEAVEGIVTDFTHLLLRVAAWARLWIWDLEIDVKVLSAAVFICPIVDTTVVSVHMGTICITFE
jgi:hypothetical protein